MPSLGFILEFYINASPDKVMGLLSDTETVAAWSGAETLIEKCTGGKFVMFDGWVEGKMLRITDNELAYTWKPSNWPEEAVPSEVHYTLTAERKGTRVVLEHTRFPNAQEMEDHKIGWSDQFFDLIERYLNNK